MSWIRNTEKNSRPELVEEERVCDDHTEEDHHQVEELAEAKVEVVATEPRPEVEEVLRYRARITVLVQRRKVIVYTFELSRIFTPSQEFSAIVLGSRSWGNREERGHGEHCVHAKIFPHFPPLKNFPRLFPDHCPVARVLDEPYTAKPAQRSSHTGPPGCIGWTLFQPM